MFSYDESALRALLTARAPSTIAEMPGGASTRRYFRVDCTKGDRKSVVAMFVPDGDKPEEIGKHTGFRRWPFLEVRDLLAERGVAVPEILVESTDQGYLVLDDLGDDTLAQFLLREPQRKRDVYTLAVEGLARAQTSLSLLPEDSIVRTRSFDLDLLHWEIQHFREWGVEARGLAFSESDHAIFEGIATRLAARIAAFPQIFVHRDYQSRNLMVRRAEDGTLTLLWIDFQDALLGPRVYDLVALLGDSYQEFDRPFIEARLDEYAAVAGLDGEARAALGREFDYVTVQRKLKDAGRFIFIDKKKGNPSFLKFFLPTLAKVRGALSRLGEDPYMVALDAVLRRTLGAEYTES